MIVSHSRSSGGTVGATSSPGAERFGAALRRAADGASATSQGRRASLKHRGGTGADRPAEPSSPSSAPSASASLLQILRASERAALSAPGSVHRVAVAIEALRSGDRARLELAFHDGAALRLDATPAGVALTLAVAPALSRVAAAELPALVAALKQRGVEVARADLRVLPERRAGGRRPR